MEIANLVGHSAGKNLGNATLDHFDLRIIAKPLLHFLKKVLPVQWHRVMTHAGAVFKKIIGPKCLWKIFPTQIINDCFYTGARICAALDEIAIELNAVKTSTRQNVSSPDDRPVRFGFGVALP